MTYQCKKNNLTLSVLLTFKLNYPKYDFYNTAFLHRPTMAVCLPFYSYLIFCECPMHFIDLQLLDWIDIVSISLFTLFTTVGFAIHSTSLISQHQQLNQQRQRPAFVRKHFDKLFRSVFFFGAKLWLKLYHLC